MRPPLIHSILRFSTSHPWLVIVLTLAGTVIFGFFAARVRINSDYSSLLPEDSEAGRLIEAYGGEADRSGLLVIAIQAEELYSPAILRAFSDLIDRIGSLDAVTSVISPFNLMSFQKAESGRLKIAPIADGGTAPDTDAGLTAFITRLASTRLAENLVVSKDKSMLVAYFQASEQEDSSVLMEQVGGILDGFDLPGVDVYISGTIPFGERTDFYISRDTTRLVLLAALVIMIFHYAGFRTVQAVFLPFAVLVFGTVWALGFMGIFGYEITLISIVAPPLIMIFGNEYGIYVMSEYYRLCTKQADDRGAAVGGRLDAINEAISCVARPILLAFVTTAIGYLSLCVTNIRQTREFAFTAAAGSLACCVLALFFLPALLSLVQRPKRRIPRLFPVDPPLWIARRTASLFGKRSIWFLLSIPVIICGFLIAMNHLSFNTDSINYFPKNDPFIRDTFALTGKIGGFDEIHITYAVPEGDDSSLLEPRVLRQIESIERRLRANPDVSYALSLVSLLGDINRALSGAEEVPAQRAMIVLFGRLVAAAVSSRGDSLPGSLVDADFTRLTITLRVYNSATGHFMDENRLREFLTFLRRTATPVADMQPVIWGEILRSLELADSLRRILIVSLLLSVASIFVIATAAFRSVLYGFYSVVPLACGLMLTFIFMAAFRIPLDMTTIMVANITVGVGIDNSIYLIVQYRRESRILPRSFPQNIEKTLKVVGRTTILATVSVAMALAAFTTAAFKPIVYFGLLVIFSLSAVAAGTLIVLPSLLNADSRIRTRWSRRIEGPR